MNELLEALGWRVNYGQRVRLISLIGSVTVVTIAAGLLSAYTLSLSIFVVHGAIWIAWLVWLGVFFPQHGRRDLARPAEQPYRRAFMREILLGVSVVFAQFLRPAAAGIASNDSATSLGLLAGGAALCLIGGAMITGGVLTLGVARTLFVHEYVAGERHVVHTQIYRFVRHPLFLGAVLASLGFAMCTANPTAITLGVLNACIGPIYARLEDRRCVGVFGREYRSYATVVGGVVPRRRSAITLSAHRPQQGGSIEPSIDRTEVSSP